MGWMEEHLGNSVTYRMVTEVHELMKVVELQKLVWEPDSLSSMLQMKAAILHGGVVAGAFDGDALVGFCYGFTGYDGKEPYICSHMMAIHPEYRDRGLGMRLKLEQRIWALQAGFHTIVWTFDPFESRNAYLNICKLGGTVSSYIPAFYGLDAAGNPTDRFLVKWSLSSDRVVNALSGQEQIMDDATDDPRLLDVAYTDARVTGIRDTAHLHLLGQSNRVKLPIPRVVSKLKQSQPDGFRTWQRRLREIATAAFAQGYHVVSCHSSEPEVQDYVLERKG